MIVSSKYGYVRGARGPAHVVADGGLSETGLNLIPKVSEETFSTGTAALSGSRLIEAIAPDLQSSPLGPEFLVNTNTTGAQIFPSVGGLASGRFVVTWQDASGTLGDNSGSSIKAQIFEANGARFGGEFLVNTEIANSQSQPTVTGLNDGGFVISWVDTGSSTIKAQLFGATGGKLGGEFVVTTQPIGGQTPFVASLASGGFVVAWRDFSNTLGDASGASIKAQLFDASGTRIGGEFLVNTQITGNQSNPTIAGLSNGGFVVSWDDPSGTLGDNSGNSVKAQVFNAAGSKVGSEFLVNTQIAGAQQEPGIASLGAGGFVIAWQDFSGTLGDASGSSIKAQLFDLSGAKVGAEFLVNTQTAGNQQSVNVAALGDGDFLVTWQDSSGTLGDASDSSIKAQQFDASGAKVGGEFLVNSQTSSFQESPMVAGIGNGAFAVTWWDFSGTLGDVSSYSVKARIFQDLQPTAAPDAAAVAENATIDIDVLLNDSDPDGGPKNVVLVQGQVPTVGQAIALASGAQVTLNADGTIAYNPNGAFDYLVDAATGTATGARSQATDSFTYGVNGGSATSVTVTINGVAGPGDQLRGTAGNDVLTGTAGGDVFYLDDGGNDAVSGGDGDDGFYFGGAYTGADSVDGGAGGLDQIGLQGDYSGGVTLGSINGVEMIVLLAGNDTRFGDNAGNFYDYNIISPDAAVAAGQRLIIQANTLRVGEDFTFNGSAETDGSFLIYGGLGTDNLTGGAGNDGFFFGQGRFGASDVINGGAGNMDQLGLQGNFTVTFGAAQMSGIEFLVLLSASDNRFGSSGGTVSYDLTMNNANVAAGQTLIISANTLTATETLTFNGSAELDGRFEIYSGDGNDVITGGSGNDLIFGGGRGDTLTGGAGNDIFAYRAVTDSNSTQRDGIQDFNAGDRIDLSRIDANTNVAGNQDFTFVGNAAFSSTAGELRFENISLGGPIWLIQGDVNGDGVSDLEIVLVISPADPITVDDFIGVNAAAQEPLKAGVDGTTLLVMDAGGPDMLKLDGLGPVNDGGSQGGHLDIAFARDFGGPAMVKLLDGDGEAALASLGPADDLTMIIPTFDMTL